MVVVVVVHDLSDEAVVQGFLENPYWHYFCGMEYFMTDFHRKPTATKATEVKRDIKKSPVRSTSLE